MIKEEYVLTRADGVEIHKHYSDEEKYIIQVETGIKYESAEDIYPCIYTYVESDEYLPSYIEKMNEDIDEQYTDTFIEKSIDTSAIAVAKNFINDEYPETTDTFEIDSNEVN